MRSKRVQLQQKRLYIADDSEAMCNVLQRYLEQEGYVVDITVNPTTLARITKLLPDVILLDLNFQGYDGSEICKTLKSRQQTKMIPVVIMSGNHDIHAIAHDCGADDYLMKPFSTETLLQIIEKHVTAKAVASSV